MQARRCSRPRPQSTPVVFVLTFISCSLTLYTLPDTLAYSFCFTYQGGGQRDYWDFTQGASSGLRKVRPSDTR